MYVQDVADDDLESTALDNSGVCVCVCVCVCAVANAMVTVTSVTKTKVTTVTVRTTPSHHAVRLENKPRLRAGSFR